MKEYTYKRFEGPNGPFFRVLERLQGGSTWLMVQGVNDWDREEDAQRWAVELAKINNGRVDQ